MAEERAPEGFADIADVLTQEELASTAVNFKKAAGLDLETVNSRDLIVELPAQALRAAFPHTACMGLSLSRVHHAIFVRVVTPFFCSTRAASILPSRPHIAVAVARNGGQGWRVSSVAARKGLSLRT